MEALVTEYLSKVQRITFKVDNSPGFSYIHSIFLMGKLGGGGVGRDCLLVNHFLILADSASSPFSSHFFPESCIHC